MELLCKQQHGNMNSNNSSNFSASLLPPFASFSYNSAATQEWPTAAAAAAASATYDYCNTFAANTATTYASSYNLYANNNHHHNNSSSNNHNNNNNSFVNYANDPFFSSNFSGLTKNPIHDDVPNFRDFFPPPLKPSPTDSSTDDFTK